jgi:hypothetical protein
LKGAWRNVLENWKTCNKNGKLAASINKDYFPSLLKSTLCKLVDKNGENIKAGFEKIGIYPVNRNKVLNMLPLDTENDSLSINYTSLVSENLTTFLKEPRYGTPDTIKKQRKKRLKVQPGKIIKGNDLNISESEDDPGEVNFDEADEPVDIEIINEAKENQQSSSSNLINMGQMSNIIKNNIKEDSWVVVKYGETNKLYFF